MLYAEVCQKEKRRLTKETYSRAVPEESVRTESIPKAPLAPKRRWHVRMLIISKIIGRAGCVGKE